MFLNALVNLLKEGIIHFVDVLQHLLAAAPLPDSQFVVHRSHMEGGLEHAQVRQCSQIINTQFRGHYSLKIYTNQRHEVFHAARFLRFIGIFPSEEF